MRAVAAALKRATNDLLDLPEMWRGSDREVWQDLSKDAEKLFVVEFGEPQKAVRNALLVGTVEAVSTALESVIASYFENRKACAPQELKLMLPPAFLHAFEQVLKDEKHEKAWKAFQRDLAWAMHQQLIIVGKGQADVLERLQAIYEGRIELPDVIREFTRQANIMLSAIRDDIGEDGAKTRQKIDQHHGLTQERLNAIVVLLERLLRTTQWPTRAEALGAGISMARAMLLQDKHSEYFSESRPFLKKVGSDPDAVLSKLAAISGDFDPALEEIEEITRHLPGYVQRMLRSWCKIGFLVEIAKFTTAPGGVALSEELEAEIGVDVVGLSLTTLIAANLDNAEVKNDEVQLILRKFHNYLTAEESSEDEKRYEIMKALLHEAQNADHKYPI